MSIPENFPVVPDHLDPTYNVDTYRELARLRARVASLEAALRSIVAQHRGVGFITEAHITAARAALAPRSERREGEPLGHRDDEERGRYRPTSGAPSSFSEALRQEAAERGEAWATEPPAAPKEEA